MKVLRIPAWRGPNLWSQHTSIEATIVCSGLENNIDTIPSFEARLRERFPEISLLQPAGHHEAVTLAHVLELATSWSGSSGSSPQRDPFHLNLPKAGATGRTGTTPGVVG